MLEKFILNYSHLHDSQIYKFNLVEEVGINNLDLFLTCISSKNEFNLDFIKLSMIDVLSFKINLNKNKGLLTIFACLLKKRK